MIAAWRSSDETTAFNLPDRARDDAARPEQQLGAEQETRRQNHNREDRSAREARSRGEGPVAARPQYGLEGRPGRTARHRGCLRAENHRRAAVRSEGPVGEQENYSGR